MHDQPLDANGKPRTRVALAIGETHGRGRHMQGRVEQRRMKIESGFRRNRGRQFDGAEPLPIAGVEFDQTSEGRAVLKAGPTQRRVVRGDIERPAAGGSGRGEFCGIGFRGGRGEASADATLGRDSPDVGTIA